MPTPAALTHLAEFDAHLSRVVANGMEASEGEAPRDSMIPDSLSLEALIDLRRQHDQIRAELDASITRRIAEGLRPEGGHADAKVLTVEGLAKLWGMKPAKVRELC